LFKGSNASDYVLFVHDFEQNREHPLSKSKATLNLYGTEKTLLKLSVPETEKNPKQQVKITRDA
jgi:hypothetical protein